MPRLTLEPFVLFLISAETAALLARATLSGCHQLELNFIPIACGQLGLGP
jgi:hypothetical protein